MSAIARSFATVGLLVVALVCLRFAMTGEYTPQNPLVYVGLWCGAVASFAMAMKLTYGSRRTDR